MKRRVIKRFPSFILGKCRCGCGRNIPIRSKYKTLLRFYHGHNMRNFKHKKKVSHKGIDANYWKGGRKKSGKYIKILIPDYYRADQNGYVLEHIYVYEQYHKCCVLKWTDVHHIDGNKHNNMPWNLETILHSIHGNIHNPKGKFKPKKDMSGRKCSNTECKDPYNTWIDKKGRQKWGRINGKWYCRKCYRKLSGEY